MSLEVSLERGLKRKSEEQLRQSKSEAEARQDIAQITHEIASFSIQRSGQKKHYVKKDIRQRMAPFCCECQRECVVEGDEGGGQCETCEHYRCLDCWAGRPKKSENRMKAKETDETSAARTAEDNPNPCQIPLSSAH